jgi:hypothetical protein
MLHSFLLAALAAAAPVPAAPVVAPAAPGAPVVADAGAVAPAADAFLQSVAIACPAGATRTSFPLVPNTLFELETVDAVSSKTNHSGDRFALRLREPLRYGAVVLVPAGTPVPGEVAHATENRWGGIAGELILAARYVQLPQGRLRLRSSIAAPGRSQTGAAATTVVLFGIVGVFVQGGNSAMPAGTPLSVRLAETVTFHCEGAPASSSLPVDAPAPATPSNPAPEPIQ